MSDFEFEPILDGADPIRASEQQPMVDPVAPPSVQDDMSFVETYPLSHVSPQARIQRFAQQGYQRVRSFAAPRRRMLLLALLGIFVTCSGLGAIWLLIQPHGQHGVGVVAQSPTASAFGDVSPTATYPIYVDGSPTPQGNGYATATPNPDHQPTATPTFNPPTPTSTPDPRAGSAAISFTRSQQTITPSSTVTACDGCAIDPTANTVPSILVSYGVSYVYGNGWSAVRHDVAATYATPTLTFTCKQSSGGVCNSIGAGSAVGPVGSSTQCVMQSTLPVLNYGQNGNVVCKLRNAGYYSFNYIGSYDGALFITAQSAYSGGSNAYTYFTMPSGCLSYGTHSGSDPDVVSHAKSAVLNYVNAHGLSGTLAPASVALNGNYYCSDDRGVRVDPGGTLAAYNGPDFYQRQDASGTRYSYTPSDTPSLQRQRIAAMTPSGYSLDTSSVQVCSAPTVLSVDLSAKHAQLSCAANGRAYYVWTPTALRSLAEQLAGKSVSQAQAILAQTTGISGGISIAVADGKTYLPSDPDAISFTVNN